MISFPAPQPPLVEQEFMTNPLQHEIKDPIHDFIYLSGGERNVVNSEPVQRLRHIHQLALSFLVYPGATHRRFEHSLGVMHLAERAYEALWRNRAKSPAKDLFPSESDRDYWLQVVRMAALCHDLGHLPFSHGAEHLLPGNETHETLSVRLIQDSSMRKHWTNLGLNPEHIAMVAVGPKAYGKSFTPWEAVMAELVVGDAFGVDRMDYLLRDSFHSGVANGGFDQHRLLERLCVLPSLGGSELTLGLEAGGLQASEAMLLARYFLFDQLYFHPVRRIYDQHLADFLHAALGSTLPSAPGQLGCFPTDVASHLGVTDNEVFAAIAQAARDSGAPGHVHAKRIAQRDHYRVLYRSDVHDQIAAETDRQKKFPEARRVYAAACEQFGADNVVLDVAVKGPGGRNFPVLTRTGRIESSLQVSRLLSGLPSVEVGFVFIEPGHREAGREWLSEFLSS